ncbi:Uncharacterized conserved protein YraI [Faunimonas pinastri]|uniref:Uncharacterized conserved protein YraI n=1 Tax=Faunimonas pinastri TaxID=1855383 RepID=A0A1H9AW94_9HYPH|nr:SH3 domain-containing protein [Faunimonas pinastri]SEP80795.1 Uncharacterized conserved protein YraI [Faunimonas pinastri]
MKRRHLLAGLALAGAAALPGIAAAATTGYSTANVNLRSGPSTQYPPVAVLQTGTPLNIYGCLTGYTWCDVNYAGNRGWVSGAYLQFMYQSRRVYVPEYAPRVGVPIVTFDVDNYWDRYYHGRTFYRERDRWDRFDWRRAGPPPGWRSDWDRGDRGPGRGPGPGPGFDRGPGPGPDRGPDWDRGGPNGGPGGFDRGPDRGDRGGDRGPDRGGDRGPDRGDQGQRPDQNRQGQGQGQGQGRPDQRQQDQRPQGQGQQGQGRPQGNQNAAPNGNQPWLGNRQNGNCAPGQQC